MRLHQLLKSLWPILGLLSAGPSFAFPWPSAYRSSVPDLLMLVGHSPLGVDPGYPFKVVVRNSDGVPVSMVTVQLVFGAVSGISLCTDQGAPGVSVDCNGRTISALCDQNGEVTFRVQGCASGTGPSGSLTVYADGFVINDHPVRVAALDQGYCDGVDGNDLSALLADIFSGQMFSRADYDGDGSLSGNDLSVWLAVFFGAASSMGCRTAVCH
jgi:hypothetical protein